MQIGLALRALIVGSALIAAGCAEDVQSAVEAPVAKSAEDNLLAARAERVEIIRDDYGVPHIYAKTDADAVFGMLYAQAEDDFPRVERNYYWAIGRLAEVEGEGALISDLRARLYMTEAEAKAEYAKVPGWLGDLCEAWADGLNYYLATHPDVTPKLITKFEPWMTMYFFEGSIGGDIEQIPLGGIRAFYGDGTPKEAPRIVEDTTDEPGGSNGIAISGAHTESGDAMLLINPHTSFYFRGESHVVSEEGLNAYGATTWGQFFIYQGFNEDTGWMHTSTYADFIDEFVEDVFERDGKLYYTYGNEQREVEVSSVTLRYKDGAGMSERTFPMYRTHHGPVTHMQDGKWVSTKINWDPVNALRQSFLRTKKENHAEFREMMGIRTNSSNNTVFADSSGNIAYYHGNFMPKRDPAFDYSEPVDGSTPATDWKGLHTVDETVTVTNPPNGWIQNANSTPYTSAGENSPKRENYPAYMAPDAENFRGLHAVDLLEAVEESGEKLTLDGLIALSYDPYLPAMDVLIDGLSAAYLEAGQESLDLGPVITALEQWDRKVAADSVAMSVAHFYALNLAEAGSKYEDLSRMERLIYMSEREAPIVRLGVLVETIVQMEQDFGTWQTPWGEINRFQRLSGDIDLAYDDDKPSIPVGMASGRWGALAAFGARAADNTKKIYGYRGNSFVAVVEFGERLKAKTLLAGGQSNDPSSPHFNDQVERYANAEFKDVPYYREDVEARAVRTYQPGE
ncbi:MAG: acylase [Hyphomonadaceae bacterium]